MDHIMAQAQPHLDKLAFVFGANCRINVVVRPVGQPGAMVFGNNDASIPEIIKALREADDISKAAAAGSGQSKVSEADLL